MSLSNEIKIWINIFLLVGLTLYFCLQAYVFYIFVRAFDLFMVVVFLILYLTFLGIKKCFKSIKLLSIKSNGISAVKCRGNIPKTQEKLDFCLLYTSPSPRDRS